MQDFVFSDETVHFDHERIPERVVHAKGAGWLTSDSIAVVSRKINLGGFMSGASIDFGRIIIHF